MGEAAEGQICGFWPLKLHIMLNIAGDIFSFSTSFAQEPRNRNWFLSKILVSLDAAFKWIYLNLWPEFCGYLLEELPLLQMSPWEVAVTRQMLLLLCPTAESRSCSP